MRAYAHARVRAAKSRLRSPSELLPVALAEGTEARRRALETIGIAADRALFPQLFERLMQFYRTTISAYGDDAEVFLAMLRLHELENVKVLWRAVIRALPAERWMPYWRDLGASGAVAPIQASTLNELVEHLADTPYADIARRVANAHGHDLAAAELAFDQWGSSMLLRVARALPPRERLARQLLESMVAARNNELTARAREVYGLSDAAIAALIDNVKPVHIGRVVTDRTFELAPAISILLLAEEELRSINRLAES